MKLWLLGAVAAATLTMPTQAATTVFSSRAAFLLALSTSITDGYEVSDGYSSGFTNYNNAGISAIFGETKYDAFAWRTIAGAELNFTLNYSGSSQAYCSGCNGSFLLDFTSTSVGTSNGVGGAGVDVVGNIPDGSSYYDAVVNFGDGSQSIFSNNGGLYFFGITSDLLIKSIVFGPNGGSASLAGNFAIDNLTIGATAAVPEPASWALMIGGFGLVGGALRSRRVRATA